VVKSRARFSSHHPQIADDADDLELWSRLPRVIPSAAAHAAAERVPSAQHAVDERLVYDHDSDGGVEVGGVGAASPSTSILQ
jgi:hypothetical protein